MTDQQQPQLSSLPAPGIAELAIAMAPDGTKLVILQLRTGNGVCAIPLTAPLASRFANEMLAAATEARKPGLQVAQQIPPANGARP